MRSFMCANTTATVKVSMLFRLAALDQYQRFQTHSQCFCLKIYLTYGSYLFEFDGRCAFCINAYIYQVYYLC